MKKLLLASLLLTGVFAATAQNETIETADKDTSPFFVTANVNFAYRIAKMADGVNGPQRDYLNKLRSGISFDLGAYYKIEREWAVGLKYNVYRSRMSRNQVYVDASPAGASGVTTISDDITISFYGASFMYTNDDSSPHEIGIEASLGYLGYRNDAYVLGDYKYTGGTVGAGFTFNYRYRFSKNFAIGPQIGMMGGSLWQYKVKGPNGYRETVKLNENGKTESLTRLDAGIVAVINF